MVSIKSNYRDGDFFSKKSKKEGYRSKVQKAGGDVKFADEFSLKTLTSKGPGKLELSKGGRAAYKMGGNVRLLKKAKEELTERTRNGCYSSSKKRC